MYQITSQDPNIKDVVPVELNMKGGGKAFVVSGQELKPDIEFDTVEKYHEWLTENIDRPKLI